MRNPWNLLLLICFLLISSQSFGTLYTFTGSGTGTGTGSRLGTTANWTPTPTVVFGNSTDTFVVGSGKSVVAASSFTVYSTFIVEGTVKTNNPNVITIASGGYFIIDGNGEIQNNSGIVIDDGGTLENNGAFTIDGDFTINGTFINDLNASIVTNGAVVVGSTGVIENNGTITVDGGSLTVSDGVLLDLGILSVVNGGTYTNNKIFSTTQSVQAYASYSTVTIQNNAAITFLGTTHIPNLTFTSGTIILQSDTLFLGNFSGFSSSNTISSTGNASLEFDSAQTGSVFFDQTSLGTNNIIKHLIINNSSANISIGNEVNISGVISPNLGTLTTGGNLTLKSSSSSVYAQIGVGSGTISGDVTYQMYLSKGFHGIGSPVSTTFSDLNEGYRTDNSIYSWDEAASNWASTDSTASMTTAKGYYGYFGEVSPGLTFNFSAPGTMNLSGSPNNGSYSIALSYHDGSGSTASFSDTSIKDGWNLVSNPYPSILDWNLVSVPGNTNASIYIWDPATDQYAAYSSGSGTGSNGGSRYIAPTQGFFVQTTSGLGASTVNLDFTNSARITNQSPSFFKNQSSFDLLSLKLKGLGDSIADELILQFNPGASLSFDGNLDAVKFFNGSTRPNLFMYSQDAKPQSIASVPEFEVSQSYPLAFKLPSGNKASFVLSLGDQENVSGKWRIYLEDKVLKTYHLMNDGDYIFQSNSTEIEARRFVIHLVKERDLTGLDKSILSLNQFSLWQDYATAFVNVPQSLEGGLSISVYSLKGEKIHAYTELKKGQLLIQLPELQSGLYIIHVIGGSQSQSILISR